MKYSDVQDQLPLKKYYFASARELAKSPPTVHSNCSERMCLHATVVALTGPPRCGRQNANRKLFLQLPMKFGDIVRVKISCTIFDKDHDTAEEGRSRSLPEVKFLQPTIASEPAYRSEIIFFQRGVEAGRAHRCTLIKININIYSNLSNLKRIYKTRFH